MNIILILQIIISVLIVILILLQERSSGLSGLFGGEGGEFYQTRRGAEKAIFISTIVLVCIFAALAVFNLVK